MKLQFSAGMVERQLLSFARGGRLRNWDKISLCIHFWTPLPQLLPLQELLLLPNPDPSRGFWGTNKPTSGPSLPLARISASSHFLSRFLLNASAFQLPKFYPSSFTLSFMVLHKCIWHLGKSFSQVFSGVAYLFGFLFWAQIKQNEWYIFRSFLPNPYVVSCGLTCNQSHWPDIHYWIMYVRYVIPL